MGCGLFKRKRRQVLFVSYPAEMSIFEVVRKLKPISQDPVKGAMSKKQQSGQHYNVRVGVKSDKVNQDSDSFVMKSIVRISANAIAENITKHAYVWCEE